jgi:hypothetical protein
MTLVLALGNNDQIIQISDRRLTDSKGEPCVLPECKGMILTLEDSRLLFGFAGLARAGRFRTGKWILDAILEAAAEDHLALGTVERFTQIASERWLKPDLQAVPQESRGLSVLFTGYNDTHPQPNLISAIVTNFQNFESGRDEEPWDEFKTTYWGIGDLVPAEEATFLQRIGAWIAMDDIGDGEKLRRMLVERRSAEAITDAAVGVVREIAGRPAARGVIGTELNSAVLPAQRVNVSLADGIALQMGFHPDGASHAVRGPNQVISTREAQLAISDSKFAADEPSSTRPVAVQKVGRNKPCPCGSGKKYKRCCGR